MDPNQRTPSPFSSNSSTTNTPNPQQVPPQSQPVPPAQQVQQTQSTTGNTTATPNQVNTNNNLETALPDLKTAPKQKNKRGGGKFNFFGFLWGLIKLPFKILNIFYYIGCVIPLFLAGIISLIIFFQPAFIWNPIKSFVNAGITVSEHTKIEPQVIERNTNNSEEGEESEDTSTTETTEQVSISEIIITELNSEETTMATISEQDLAYLIGNQFELNNAYLDIDPNEINILINTDADSPDEPLWLELKIILEDGKFKLSESNLGRIPLPAGVLNTIRIPVLSDFLASGRLTDSEEVFELLLDENISIETTTIIDEEITIE